VGRGATIACVLSLLTAGLLSSTAKAAVTVGSLTASLSSTQAGEHADLTVSFAFEASGEPESVEEVDLGLPAGFFLAPYWNRCSLEDLDASECPPGSQVGLITLYLEYDEDPFAVEPVYMVEPGADDLARLGFAIPSVQDPIQASVRSRSGFDYGLDLVLHDLPQSPPVSGAELSLWGIPNDESHDTERPLPGECFGQASCVTPPRPPGSLPLPFLTNPTRCGVPLEITLEAHTYEQPAHAIGEDEGVPTIVGCHRLPFSPTLDLALTTARTNMASGFDLGLRIPPADGVEALEPAAASYVEVAMPRALRVAPVGTPAPNACTDAEFGVGSGNASACPAGSEVGSFSLDLADFEAPLEGKAFLGVPFEGAHLLLLEASRPGARVKLEALVEPLSSERPAALYFPEVPEIPIRDLDLSVTNDAGLLLTPSTCGTYLAEGAIESWASNSFVTSQHPLPLTIPGPAGWTCTGPPPLPTVGPVSAPTVRPVPPRAPARPPVARLTTDPPKRTTRQRMKLRFVSNQPAATFECKLDKAPWRRCASPKTVRGLDPGRHVFKVRAVDAGGERGPADRLAWRVIGEDQRS
jgi:hypothetical protein